MVLPLLRYPGAKGKVIKKFVPFWDIPHKEYREPFAGSGAIFLRKPLAKKNWLNDLDEEIISVLIAIKNYPEEFCKLINLTSPTIDLWLKLKKCVPQSLLCKAYRTLVRNRTSYSGIIGANPIGGIKQESIYKIDCRWNPDRLCEYVKRCAKKLVDVEITFLDYSEVIEAPGKEVFMIIDPPYYHKGKLLYQKNLEPLQHQELAASLKVTKHKFLLTYDDCQEVREMYQGWSNIIEEGWIYSTSNGERKQGKELFITNF